MQPAQRERRYELDHLRVLATLGVILLHTGAIVVIARRDSAPDLLSVFNVGNAADSLGRFAVNCFFMVSGALLLDPARRFALRKQFLRVALPTLTWILLYAAANLALHAQGIRGVTGALRQVGTASPGELARRLVEGAAVYHLWFVYVLLGIYLVVPLLRAITDRPEARAAPLVRWFLVLWLVTDLVPRWVGFFLGHQLEFFRLPLQPGPTGYVGLFVLGYALAHPRGPRRIPGTAWAVIAVAGLVWTFTAVWHAASTGGPNVFAAYDNLNPPVLLFSVGVFAWFAGRPRGPGPRWSVVRRLSDLSFRVYLVHALVLHVLRFTTGLGDLAVERPLVGVPAIYLLTVVLSTLAAWLLDLARPLRRWV